jgi:hypothetical protein
MSPGGPKRRNRILQIGLQVYGPETGFVPIAE